MDLDKVIKKRASVRKYRSKKPKIELVIEAIESANRAPSPGNLPVLRYIIVEDKKKIVAISEACQQSFIEQAPVLVVFCSDSSNASLFYGKRSDKYVKQAVGAAIENFLLKITDLGLASCWIGAFLDPMVKNLLKIPDNVEVEAIFPVGYPKNPSEVVQRKKYELDNKLFFEIYGEKKRLDFTKVRREDL